MPEGIVIPVDEDAPLYKQHFEDFTDYQAVIGGYFQPVDLLSPSATIYTDEEGKLKGLDINRRATLLTWMHNPAFRNIDVICGPAILIGVPDSEGETQPVPAELEQLLLDTEAYKVEVTTYASPETWNGNQARYGDWVTAYNAGLSLAIRWLAVDRVRVTAA